MLGSVRHPQESWESAAMLGGRPQLTQYESKVAKQHLFLRITIDHYRLLSGERHDCGKTPNHIFGPACAVESTQNICLKEKGFKEETFRPSVIYKIAESVL